MIYLHKNLEFVIKNEKSDNLLEVIKVFFPQCISQTKKGINKFNVEIAGDILYADFEKKYLEGYNGIFPCFRQKNSEGELVEVKRSFVFNILHPTVELSVGSAFGELALLNDKPRSATIMTVEDTHFAILEKDDFKTIMEKLLKDKFAAQVNFLSGFPFLSGMTRITKEKLGFMMKKKSFKLGNEVVIEGDQLNDLFLIESGEFEINKTVYINRKRENIYGHFLRAVSLKHHDDYGKILTEKSSILLSDNANELQQTKSATKLYPKKIFRLSILGKQECFGITDCILG